MVKVLNLWHTVICCNSDYFITFYVTKCKKSVLQNFETDG